MNLARLNLSPEICAHVEKHVAEYRAAGSWLSRRGIDVASYVRSALVDYGIEMSSDLEKELSELQSEFGVLVTAEDWLGSQLTEA